MLPRAVACGETAKGKHCPEVAVCKIVEGRRLGEAAKGRMMLHGTVCGGTANGRKLPQEIICEKTMKRRRLPQKAVCEETVKANSAPKVAVCERQEDGGFHDGPFARRLREGENWQKSYVCKEIRRG